MACARSRPPCRCVGIASPRIAPIREAAASDDAPGRTLNSRGPDSAKDPGLLVFLPLRVCPCTPSSQPPGVRGAGCARPLVCCPGSSHARYGYRRAGASLQSLAVPPGTTRLCAWLRLVSSASRLRANFRDSALARPRAARRRLRREGSRGGTAEVEGPGRVRPVAATRGFQPCNAGSIPAHDANNLKSRRRSRRATQTGRNDWAAPEPVTGIILMPADQASSSCAKSQDPRGQIALPRGLIPRLRAQ